MHVSSLLSGGARWARTHLASPSPDFCNRKDAVAIGAATVGSVGAMAVAGADAWPNIHGLPSGSDLPLDKIVHAQGTCLATILFSAVLGMPPWLAASSTFVVGTLGKELVYDRLLGHGTPDVKDAFANLSGCLAGYAMSRAIEARRKAAARPGQPPSGGKP